MNVGRDSRSDSRMTWRPHALALLGCVVAALVSTPAWSAGIGANFTYGSSQGKDDDDGDFFSDINTSADLFEAGVSFDTNLAQDRLINYRVNANYQRVELKHPSQATTSRATKRPLTRPTLWP